MAPPISLHLCATGSGWSPRRTTMVSVTAEPATGPARRGVTIRRCRIHVRSRRARHRAAEIRDHHVVGSGVLRFRVGQHQAGVGRAGQGPIFPPLVGEPLLVAPTRNVTLYPV